MVDLVHMRKWIGERLDHPFAPADAPEVADLLGVDEADGADDR